MSPAIMAVWGLLATSCASALATWLAPSPAAARARARLGAALSLGCGCAAWLYSPAALGGVLLVDALNAPLLVLVTLVTTAVIGAGPKRALGRVELTWLLLTQLGAVLSLVAARPGLIAAALLLGLLPAYWSVSASSSSHARSKVKRTFLVFVVCGTLPLAVCLLALDALGIHLAPWTHATSTGPVTAHLQHSVAHWGLLVMGLGLLVRMAVCPVHSWFPVLFEHGPLGLPLLLVSSNAGAYLIARLGLPDLAARTLPGLALLSDIGLVTVLYGALLALGQRDLRRLVGCVALSHRGLLLAGLGSGTESGVSGALVHWVAVGLSITGLSLCAWALEARTGTTDLSRLGGLATRAPTLSGAFVVFALATVGLPGTLGFVSEDFLVHGLLEHHPYGAGVMVLATACNAIALLRAHAQAFWGPPRSAAYPCAEDLKRGERLSLVALAAILVGLGLYPAPLTHGRGQLRAPRSGVRTHRTPDMEPRALVGRAYLEQASPQVEPSPHDGYGGSAEFTPPRIASRRARIAALSACAGGVFAAPRGRSGTVFGPGRARRAWMARAGLGVPGRHLSIRRLHLGARGRCGRTSSSRRTLGSPFDRKA